MSSEDSGKVINEILTDDSTTSVYRSYFYVQRGFYKPKLRRGSLQQLQDIQRQSEGTQGPQAKNRNCLLSFYNSAKGLVHRLTNKMQFQSGRAFSKLIRS